MSIEVGNVIPGKVTGITNFGVFVDLGDRKTGLVHISEVSDSYIQDIKEVLKVGDEVKVKVMTIADNGKISLSIRRAVDKPKEDSADKAKKSFTKRNQDSQDFKKNRNAGRTAAPYEKKSPSQAKATDFDSLMSSFLKDSEDRLTSLKRNTEGKRGGRGGRRS